MQIDISHQGALRVWAKSTSGVRGSESCSVEAMGRIYHAEDVGERVRWRMLNDRALIRLISRTLTASCPRNIPAGTYALMLTAYGDL